MKRLFGLLLLVLLPLCAHAADDGDLLAPDDAFSLKVSVVDANTVRATWTIADGYYMYRNKISFSTDTPGYSLGQPALPAGKVKHDEFFGDIQIYRHSVSVDIPVAHTASAAPRFTLMAKSQGCADAGVCYPPHRQSAELTLPALPASASEPAPQSGSGELSKLGQELGLGGQQQDEVLPPDQAFAFSAHLEGDTVIAHWEIAPKHYLYRNKLKFEIVDGKGITLGKAEIPPGDEKNDEFFGRIFVFHHSFDVKIPLQRAADAADKVSIRFHYQGCAEAGICYPPMKKVESFDLAAVGAGAATAAASPDTTRAPAMSAGGTGPLSEQDSLARSLAGGDTFGTIALFFGLGLLLAFTPCVFPMIPILSSIIVGQGAALTTRKAFTLSLVYVLAMAITYTVAGVIAGLFGSNIQAAFQNPWVLGSFAAVFVALSLSMFGFYELQLPSALQSKLTEVSNRQQGGSLFGVAIMGLLSALIVGPCVAPPLMGALIYIGQTGDPWLGGAALFALSLGMGAPLLVIGTSAGKLLPRAGGWMDAIKAVFGVLLLAVAIWMLERILPATVTLLLWAVLIIVSAIYMGALEPIREGASGWRRLWKGLGVVLLIYGAVMLIGLASGGSDPLAPLAQMRGGVMAGAAPGGTESTRLQFTRVKNIEALDRQLAAAKAQGKPVMLDFYADWCVSCKEFEKYTFSNPGVKQALAGAVLLQADVTDNSDADKALMRRFKLIGPPSILFFGPDGQERRNARVVGYMEAESFRRHVEQAIK